MVFEEEVHELRKRFMNHLFDETEGDEYKTVSFDLIYNRACYNEHLELYDTSNEILKNLVKQDLLNKNYILLDDSNVENILITTKGKEDYLKL